MTVLAQHKWKSNAELIADVAKLGYIGDFVLDTTYGKGTFWKVHRPVALVANIYDEGRRVTFDPDGKVSGLALPAADVRALPWVGEVFDTAVFDGPYKLNGTPDPTVDERYGVHEPTRWQDRMALLHDGVRECARVVKPKGTLLVKCQDQVVSGHMVWQTDELTRTAERCGLRKIDRFDLLGKARKQPMEEKRTELPDGTVKVRKARRQQHAHGRGSTLLVFRKVGQ